MIYEIDFEDCWILVHFLGDEGEGHGTVEAVYKKVLR